VTDAERRLLPMLATHLSFPEIGAEMFPSRWLLAKHIGPHLGRVPIGKFTPEMVREWHATLLGNGIHTQPSSARPAAHSCCLCSRT